MATLHEAMQEVNANSTGHRIERTPDGGCESVSEAKCPACGHVEQVRGVIGYLLRVGRGCSACGHGDLRD